MEGVRINATIAGAQVTTSYTPAVPNSQIVGEVTEEVTTGVSDTQIVGDATEEVTTGVPDTQIVGDATEEVTTGVPNTQIVGDATEEVTTGDTSVEECDFSLAGSMVCDPISRLVPTGFARTTCTDETETIMFINAGGDAPLVLDSRLNIIGDTCFIGGDVLSTEEPIVEAGEYSFIYQSARAGTFSYRLDKLLPGEYFIDSHFAEIIIANGPKGKRVFNVYLQDEKVLTGFDIYSLVGTNKPLMLVDLRVIVKDDGLIRVRFEGINGRPVVSGICVRKTPKVTSQEKRVLSQLEDLLQNAKFGLGTDGIRPVRECQAFLSAIKSLPLSKEMIVSSELIEKIQPFCNIHTKNSIISKEAQSILQHLKEIIEDETKIPEALTSNTKELFETLRVLCGKKISREISSRDWSKVRILINRLLEVSTKSDSDLSSGSKMTLSIEFLCQEGLGDIKNLAKLLSQKIGSDQNWKKVGEAITSVKYFADSVRRRLYMDYLHKKTVDEALTVLLNQPSNRVRDSFLFSGSFDQLRYLAANGPENIREKARRLLINLSS